MLSVLLDLSRSIAAAGGRRLVIVNGHGGNTGVCHAAAAAASTRFDLAVAHLDYWSLVPPGEDVPVPGHAGAFETSLMMAVRPDLAIGKQSRYQVPVVPAVDGVDIHSAQVWTDLTGYTDEPDEADVHRGRNWRNQIAAHLGDRLVELSRAL
jgi:creatinine amidohydrolase